VGLDRTFWWLMVFPALALAIAVLIVWWTIPRKRKPDERAGGSGAAGRED
jgi:cytochrome c-type biogenesis protein CcmH/NrfF